MALQRDLLVVSDKAVCVTVRTEQIDWFLLANIDTH